jgi:U6 snRNA-associated Sm-like protein LSm6
MSDASPAPEDHSGPAQHFVTGSPTDFLKGVVGKRVVVRLTSGVDYRGMYSARAVSSVDQGYYIDWVWMLGVLACLDGYMNIALEQTEEHVNGRVTNRYGDTFIRGNNGEHPQPMCIL